MLSRREFFVAGAAAAALGACTRSRPASAIAWPRTTVHAGISFIELFPADADESSPIVVAVHGRGDRPDRWVDGWRTFPARVRIALPRAPAPFGDGFSWFEFRDGMTDEQFGAEVGAAEDKLWRGIADLVDRGQRLFVTGFSQGGILSYAMASRHPDAVVYAFPVAGSCPGPLLPKNHARAAPILAFHGTEDDVLNVRWAREAVAAFETEGNRAELREYAGVRHALTARMRADLWSAMVQEIARSPARDR